MLVTGGVCAKNDNTGSQKLHCLSVKCFICTADARVECGVFLSTFGYRSHTE